jgi:23S rRNA (guanosine2251-2'-O)-methyltransferase
MRKLDHLEIPRLQPEALDVSKRHPIKLLLHDIRSAHNVGAALRTADGALIEEVIISGFTPSPEHKAVIKTALGAQDYVPWRTVVDPGQFLSDLKKEGYRIAALELTTDPTPLESLAIDDFPMCLVAGNEVEGVHDDLLALCDLALEIPQYGAKQSLNVSVAIGIALFDLVRLFRSL